MVSVRATAVDAADAQTLLAEYVAMRAATFPGQYTPAQHPPAMFTPPTGVFLLVCDDGGSAVGCGGVRRIGDGPAGPRYEVKHVFLRPVARGRGWSRLLMDELEHRARGWGASELVLDTHHTLEAAAGLYAACGFTPIAPYNDNPNATVWLRKVLD